MFKILWSTWQLPWDRSAWLRAPSRTSRDGSLLHRTKPWGLWAPNVSQTLVLHRWTKLWGTVHIAYEPQKSKCFPNLGAPHWSTRGSARDNWCFGTSVCIEVNVMRGFWSVVSCWTPSGQGSYKCQGSLGQKPTRFWNAHVEVRVSFVKGKTTRLKPSCEALMRTNMFLSWDLPDNLVWIWKREVTRASTYELAQVLD